MSKRPRREPGAESVWNSWSFVAATGLLAVLVILAITLVIIAPSARTTPAARAAHATPGAPAVLVERPAASACGLGDGDQTTPTTAPRGTRWELVGTMLAPTAPKTLGPGRVTDGIRSCFAHSPMGALYAAVNFWALGTAKPSSVILRRLATDTPERAEAIASLEQESPGPAIRETMQVAGFRFVSSEADVVTVSLAFRLTTGTLTTVPTPLQWEDGDWKYVIAPGGNPGISELRDLTGYIAWSGA